MLMRIEITQNKQVERQVDGAQIVRVEKRIQEARKYQEPIREKQQQTQWASQPHDCKILCAAGEAGLDCSGISFVF